MIGRWWYYNKLAFLDLMRLWPSVQHHVIIVAGICLPVLILMALKQGYVEDLRVHLLRTPSGREVPFWPAQRGELLTPDGVARLEKEIPNVELIIPDNQAMGAFLSKGKDSSETRVDRAALFPTRRGDPWLEQEGCDVLEPREKAVVLNEFLAKKLDAKVGDKVTFEASRQTGPNVERATVELKVKGILRDSTADAPKAFLDIHLVDWVRQYIQGYRVAELEWSAQEQSAKPGFPEYLIVCEASDDLQEADKRRFKESGYVIEPVAKNQIKSLYAFLNPEKSASLRFYSLATPTSKTSSKWKLNTLPSAIARELASDAAVMGWVPPRTCQLDGKVIQIVGLSVPPTGSRGSWFKLAGYFLDNDLPFEHNIDDELSIKVSPPSESEKITLRPFPTMKLDLETVPTKASWKTPSTGIPVAVVPVTLLAHLQSLSDEEVEFDPKLRLFVQRPKDPQYLRLRLYTNTIDDVPAVVKELHARGYAYDPSSERRISEIHEQDALLQFLVILVAGIVFLFGIITVFSVLVDSTDRKRGTIGILRVMGVSKIGVFYLIFLRAAMIAVLSSCVTLLFGYGAVWFLNWAPTTEWIRDIKPVVSAMISLDHVLYISLGAFVCCTLGTLLPAWRASRIDPLDAIIEGRFR